MLDIERTKFLVINGKNVSIDEFPKNIRQEVELFDDIKSDLKDIEKKAKVLVLALTAQTSKISQLMEQHHPNTTEPPVATTSEQNV